MVTTTLLLIITLGLIILGLLVLISFWYYPETMLKPYNQVISYFCDNYVYYPKYMIYDMLPGAYELEREWLNIRKEGWNLVNLKRNSKVNVLEGYKNLNTNQEDMFEGWNQIPLKFFNNYSETNCLRCPVTSTILYNHPYIVSMLFSVIVPGKEIVPHINPFKGLLRIHLGLDIPDPSEGECYIMVDNIKYRWQDGELMMFDGNYIHSVKNLTSKHRLILMLDIKTPLNFSPASYLNDFLISLISRLPQTKKAAML